MARTKKTQKQIEEAKVRNEMFKKLFRYFDSVNEGVKWCQKITGRSSITIMTWRCSGEKSGYHIPELPFKKLIQAAKKSKRFVGLEYS